MKLRSLFLLLVIGGPWARAQEYKKFRFGGGIGLIGVYNPLPSGFLLYAEPSYRLNDRLVLGLRVETMGQSTGRENIGVMGSYTVNANFYFKQESPHFFAGLGAGVYTPNRGPLAYCSCENEPTNETVLGFYPRIGWEFRHTVLQVEYNIVQALPRMGYSNIPPLPMSNPVPYIEKTSYLSVKFGFLIGGGRKKQ
jgi:hypothetical protein